MSKSPAFQFYVKDWLSSSKVQLMTPAQEGAYIRLLAYCWDSGDCSLPDDDEELAALSRLGEGWFNGGSRVVRKCFVPHPKREGFLTNERLYAELVKQSAWKEKSSEGGKISAQKRKEKSESKGGSRVVQPNVNLSSSIAIATQVPPPTPSLPDWMPAEEWGAFVEMRRAKRVPLTATAVKLIVKRLDELRQRGQPPAAVLSQSVIAGWTGVFELKLGKPPPHTPPKPAPKANVRTLGVPA